MQSLLNGQPGPPGDKPPLIVVRDYALAALCLAIAFVVRAVLDPIWGNHFPYVIFFIAVFVVIQTCGNGAFLFTLAASVLLADWFFIPPRHSLLISTPADRVNTVLYFIISFTMFYFAVRTRRARGRERVAREELRSQAQANSRLAAIVESSDDAIIGKSLDGTILTWNEGAERLYGYTAAEAVGQSIAILLPNDKKDELASLLEKLGRGEYLRHFETARRAKDGRLIEVSLSISPIRDETGQIVAASTIARDITEQKRVEREKERLVQQLQNALSEIKTLSGMLPICAGCKKIRDDKGYWNQIELYIRDHSNAKFTHGICPECAARLYPGIPYTPS